MSGDIFDETIVELEEAEEAEPAGVVIEASATLKPVKRLLGPPEPVDFSFTKEVVQTWMNKSWFRRVGVFSRVFIYDGAVPVPENDPEGKKYLSALSVVAKFIVNSLTNNGIVIMPEKYSEASQFQSLEKLEPIDGYIVFKK